MHSPLWPIGLLSLTCSIVARPHRARAATRPLLHCCSHDRPQASPRREKSAARPRPRRRRRFFVRAQGRGCGPCCARLSSRAAWPSWLHSAAFHCENGPAASSNARPRSEDRRGSVWQRSLALASASVDLCGSGPGRAPPLIAGCEHDISTPPHIIFSILYTNGTIINRIERSRQYSRIHELISPPSPTAPHQTSRRQTARYGARSHRRRSAL